MLYSVGCCIQSLSFSLRRVAQACLHFSTVVYSLYICYAADFFWVMMIISNPVDNVFFRQKYVQCVRNSTAADSRICALFDSKCFIHELVYVQAVYVSMRRLGMDGSYVFALHASFREEDDKKKRKRTSLNRPLAAK